MATTGTFGPRHSTDITNEDNTAKQPGTELTSPTFSSVRDLESAKCHNVGPGHGSKLGKEVRVEFEVIRDPEPKVISLLVFTLALTCVDLLMCFLRLFNDQLDGLTGSVARIVAYQFSVPIISIVAITYLILLEGNFLIFLRRFQISNALISRIPEHLTDFLTSSVMALLILVGSILETTSINLSKYCPREPDLCKTIFHGNVLGESKAATAFCWACFAAWAFVWLVAGIRVHRTWRGKPSRRKRFPRFTNFQCPSCSSELHYDFQSNQVIIMPIS